jgi:Uma2 family endonuclease
MRRSAIADTLDVVTSPSELRHLRPVEPLSFPANDPEWEMGESIRHTCLCYLLHLVLRNALGDAHTAGIDNFVYWDASNPRRKCAPDGFVKLGVPHTQFDSWKVWEHGAPELAIEILSPSDHKEKLTWAEKMERYHALGVRELVAFDADAPPGKRLRAWDRMENDLVERAVEKETTPCLTLGLHWVVVPSKAPSGEDLAAALRLARDVEGRDLLLTSEEALRRENEALRAALANRP